MKFTLRALLPPFALFIFAGLIIRGPRDNRNVLGLIAMVWGFFAFWATVVYWVARIWRRATRERDPHPPQYPGFHDGPYNWPPR
jgi:hypothetical protein